MLKIINAASIVAFEKVSITNIFLAIYKILRIIMLNNPSAWYDLKELTHLFIPIWDLSRHYKLF